MKFLLIFIISAASISNSNIKDKTSKYNSQYLLFKEKIPFSAVPDRVNDILALINDINFEEIQNSSLKIVDNEELNTRLKNALSVIYELAKKNNLLKTPSIEINFVVKMIVWIQDNLKNIVWKLEDNPKVFYFGKIKEHEALFLFLIEQFVNLIKLLTHVQVQIDGI